MSVTCKRNWDVPIEKVELKWVDDELSQRSIEYLIYVVMILTLNFIIYLNVILIELKKRGQHIPNYYSRYLSTLTQIWKDSYQFVTFEKYFIVYL
jgi:hypothetical protein